MKKIKKITLSKEEKEKALEEIKSFFFNERNEDIGNIASEIFLDFISDKIAPYYYNLGITDAQKYIKDRADDLFELTF